MFAKCELFVKDFFCGNIVFSATMRCERVFNQMLPHCKGFLLITAKHNIKLQSSALNEKVVLLNTVISLVLE